MTETTGSPAEAPHPHLETDALTDEQRRGAACVYCGLPVSTGHALDLGDTRDTDGTRIFPRAHPDCARPGVVPYGTS